MPTPASNALTPTPTPASALLAQSAGFGQIALMLFVLIAVLVGVFYATRLFARLAQRGMTRPGTRLGGRERSIYLIDRLALDRDKSIVLIEEGDKRFLMSVTPQEIRLLRETDAPLPEGGMDGANDTASKPLTFQELFRAWKDRGKE